MIDKSVQPEKRGVHTHAVLVSVVIFILLIVGMFAFAILKNSEQETVVNEPDPSTEEPIDDQYSYIDRIEGKHFYIDGIHTIVGEIAMPTPCDLLQSDVFIAESYPEQVTLDFSVLNNAEVCTQVITPARFKVSAKVSEDAIFSARFNGRRVELNLTPALPGETPDEFEIFTKG